MKLPPTRVQPERRRLLGVRVHPRLLSCGAFGAALRLVHLRRRSCPSQGRFRGLLDKCGRGRRSIGPLACGMLAAICRRESSVLAKASAEPCDAVGFCLGFPDRPPMQGFLARLVCRYAREAVRSAGFARAREGRHPHRIAGDELMSPGILWGCRACGAQRRVPGNSPAALERACGRWGSKRGGGGSGSRCAGGTGGRSSTPKGGLFPAGWWDGALGALET